MFKKLMIMVMAVFLTMSLAACNNIANNDDNKDNPVVEDPNNNDEQKDKPEEKDILTINYEELGININDYLPNSYVNYGNGTSTNISSSNSLTVTKQNLYYRNSVLYQQLDNNLKQVNELYNDVQLIYNEILNSLEFYEDETYAIKDLDSSINATLVSYVVDENNALKDIELDITIDKTNTNIAKYNFDENIFIKLINCNESLSINITNESNKDNTENAIFNFIDYKNGNLVASYKDINLNIEKDEKNSKIVSKSIKVKVSEATDKKVVEEVVENLYFYGDNNYGAILNDKLTHNYNTTLNDEYINTNKKVHITDFETIGANEGLIYKAIVSKSEVNSNGTLVEKSSSSVGFPASMINNWNKSEVNGNNVKLTLNDKIITQSNLFNSYITFSNHQGLIDEEVNTGFDIVDTNVYQNDQQNIYGYFVQTKNEVDSIYKLYINLDNSKYDGIEISSRIKKPLKDLQGYFYNWMLEERNIKPNNDFPDISETISQTIIADRNIRFINTKDTKNQTVLLMFDENNKFLGYKISEFTFIKDFEYFNDSIIMYGTKLRKPYFAKIDFDENNNPLLDSMFEYMYRRTGSINSVTYDEVEKIYYADFKLGSGFSDTFMIDEKNNMFVTVYEHLTQNYSVGVTIEPEYIVIHETANTGFEADALMHFIYFNTSDRQASTHFIVDDTTAYQVLDLNNRAWHVGDNKIQSNGEYYSQIFNSNTVGIEMSVNSDGDYDQTVDNTARLTAQLMIELNVSIDHVVRHKDASGKNCPAIMNATPGAWEAFKVRVEEIYNELISQ